MPGLWLLPTRALLLLAWLCFYFGGFSLPSLLLFIPSCRSSLSQRKRTNRRNCQRTNKLKFCKSAWAQVTGKKRDGQFMGSQPLWSQGSPQLLPTPLFSPGWPDAVLQTSQTIQSSSVFALQGSTASMRHLCKTQARSSLLQKFEHSALDLRTNFSSSGLSTPVPTPKLVIQVFTASINSDFTFKSHFLHLSILYSTEQAWASCKRHSGPRLWIQLCRQRNICFPSNLCTFTKLQLSAVLPKYLSWCLQAIKYNLPFLEFQLVKLEIYIFICTFLFFLQIGYSSLHTAY